ncbi:putative peptidase family-domain-containing protein [Chaetomidium leptoderma]|uniref:Peptidase family-domain-containing protein n=1 Tax=Chaetomidium leptoderma TaxID=669021 RepID=A0AAN6ZYC3_9PEZI|nr:putative peptidase family-domain-containing protein [Chaetomidium leptoderma]
MIELYNFPTGQDAEVSEVYQRCVLVSGNVKSSNSAREENDEGYVVVETNDNSNNPLFPEQRWPTCGGYFKALALLSPGLNQIIIKSEQDVPCRIATPPLHLAIMVAKDSPLLIDCPPAKFGSVSSAHSSLDAAIAKFRTTAYMWQALTAEDFRAKGLGRRSFRLEEEWSADTLSQRFLNSPTMGQVPKIHLIRTDKTVAELRNPNFAQQNRRAHQKEELHKIFTNALLAHGAPFTTQAKPIVAGLILDAHYDLSNNTTNTNLILAHAALGSHNPHGLSLGMFGSHLAYAWPRCLEEVAPSLLDTACPGDTVGNDNDECDTLWRACAVGQGAFLHEIKCEGGIARVVFTPKGKEREGDERASIVKPVRSLRYLRRELAERFRVGTPVALEVTAMNGKQYSVANIWNLFRNRAYIPVPGTDIQLMQQSVSGGGGGGGDGDDDWAWAVMLKKRDSKGNLVDASKVDIRVGCGLDGAVVYYNDGEKIPCGPRGQGGNDPGMGGHQARKIALPKGVEISKVAVTRGNNGYVPPSSHKIIGFYGASGKWGMCNRFGIVAAPRDAVLPDSVYDMEELQNKPEEEGRQNKRRRIFEEDDEEEEDRDDDCSETPDGSCTSEDVDGNYDDGSDAEMEEIYQR